MQKSCFELHIARHLKVNRQLCSSFVKIKVAKVLYKSTTTTTNSHWLQQDFCHSFHSYLNIVYQICISQWQYERNNMCIHTRIWTGWNLSYLRTYYYDYERVIVNESIDHTHTSMTFLGSSQSHLLFWLNKRIKTWS
jgi:hypothetical protein